MKSTLVSYLETALWSRRVILPVPEDELVDGCMDVDEDHPLRGVNENDFCDFHFCIDDFTDEARSKAEAELDNFFDHLDNLGLSKCVADYADSGRIAHDFWLTRNGHGAGFFDGDYGDYGQELTEIAKRWREQYIFADEDGRLHIEDG